MALLKTLFGVDLPTAGKVVGKASDPARSVTYQGIAGTQTINAEPIFWLEIKDGKKKPRWVQVPKKTYDALSIGSMWASFAETDPKPARTKRPRL
jgi:hypothetical protein